METLFIIFGTIFCVLLIYYFGGLYVIVDDYLNTHKYTEADLWRVCRHLTSEERQLYQKIYDIIKNTDPSTWKVHNPESLDESYTYDIDNKIRLVFDFIGGKVEAISIVISWKDGSVHSVNNLYILDPVRVVSMEAQDFLVGFANTKYDKYTKDKAVKDRSKNNKLYLNGVKEALKHI